MARKEDDNRSYEDLVEAVRAGEGRAESTLYEKCRSYFLEHIRILPHLKAELVDDIFQDSFLVIWTEIQNGKIFVKDGRIARINKYGEAAFLKCNLTSFLMAVARNRHFNIIRTEGPAVMVDIDGRAIMGDPVEIEPSDKEIRQQIIDEEIDRMSQRCREILKWFYVKGLSLEQILMKRSENTSKDGLKTSKSKCLKQLKDNSIRREELLYV